MKLRNKKRALLVTARGLLLVLLAVILHVGGYLSSLESLLYDLRVRRCQGYQPLPAEPLVHLDVDDNALGEMGHWPWPGKLARVVDEIARAKPKVLVMDVLFTDDRKGDSAGAQEDRQLADAFKRLGCALIPVSLTLEKPAAPSTARRLFLPLLVEDPERTKAQCVELARPQGLGESDIDQDSSDSFISISEAAFYERIWSEFTKSPALAQDQDALRKILLPHADPMLATVLGRRFDEQYARVLREWKMRPFELPLSAMGSTPLLSASNEKSPILPMSDAAAYSGFVDDLPETVEGTVRAVPLLARFRDHLVPQMGLVAACVALGVDVQHLELSNDSLRIHRPGESDIQVPVSVRDSSVVGSVGALMDVPMFGRPRDWKTMYDVPRHQTMAKQVSVLQVWQICQTIDRLDRNLSLLDQYMRDALALNDPEGERAFTAAPPTGDALHEAVKNEIDVLGPYIEYKMGDEQKLAAARQILPLLKPLDEQGGLLQKQLVMLRSNLFTQLHDKAIFFGGTATSLSDLRPTSLFGSTPGVMVHGAVFNAILTGKMWKRVPPNVGYVITAGLGLLTLAMVSGLSPGKAFAGAVVLGLGYLAINGYLLFARDNLILDAAGPSVAVGLVWAGMTVGNYVTDLRDRARITRRFRSYVDPAVVDYYVLHPEHKGFDGERKELTIGFSDLAGFTTLTDQLGERVVPLLAEYMGYMVPVIRGYRGTFDKQIGDGICFFFGAPIPDDQHARRAVETALAMHKSLDVFNETLKARGLQTLGMRIGLATGEVIVGDAGAASASSYTTLGATTNLSSRLEGANKVFGTHTLATARTIDLSNGAFLTRPIANIQVAGKLDCVVVHEPMCLMSDATDQQRELARCTTAVFNAYRDADFARCLAAVAEMDAAFSPSKFTKLYAKHAADAPDVDRHCGGMISMTEK